MSKLGEKYNKTGQGKMNYVDGRVYEGIWLEDHQLKGKIKWPDGSTFKGNFKKGEKEGYGLMCYTNGTWYDGNWQKD